MEEPVICPNGHNGPWHFVEERRTWWNFALIGGYLFLAPEPVSGEPVRGAVLMCRAEVDDDGSQCCATVAVPATVRVIRDGAA